MKGAEGGVTGFTFGAEGLNVLICTRGHRGPGAGAAPAVAEAVGLPGPCSDHSPALLTTQRALWVPDTGGRCNPTRCPEHLLVGRT